MRPVTVQFLKNPDVPHWGFEATWLGEDDWGQWIAAPMGTTRWRGDLAKEPTGEDAVFCLPRAGWWHLHYTGAATEFSHFVDIVTPPRWVSSSRYEMIDLDLDVVRNQSGRVEVQDEDEFEVHQVKYTYTPEMIRRAVEETRLVVKMLETGSEPFFTVAESWLARLRP